MGAQVPLKWPQEYHMPPPVQTTDLERMIAGLDEGLPIGDEVREKIADALCDLLDRIRKEGYEKSRMIALMEERIQNAEREMAKKMEEAVKDGLYGRGTGRVYGESSGPEDAPMYYSGYDTIPVPKPKKKRDFKYTGQTAKWINEVSTDQKKLIAPDGTVIARVDKLKLIQFKSNKALAQYLQDTERKAMQKWLIEYMNKEAQ